VDTTVTRMGAVVVTELRAAGYAESTIGQYAKTIRALAGYAKERGGVYSLELGAEFASMTVSPRTGRFSAQRRLDYGRLVGVFDAYVHTGRVDLSVRGRGGGGPRPEVVGLAVLDAAWEADMGRRGLAPATRDAYGRVARSYLVFLEERGIVDLDEADGTSVLAFLESLLDRWAKSVVDQVLVERRRVLPFELGQQRREDRDKHEEQEDDRAGHRDLVPAEPAESDGGRGFAPHRGPFTTRRGHRRDRVRSAGQPG
jgi:hypothetical protein